MSVSETVDLLAGEAIIFGIVWVFYSADKPVLAAILFVTLHLIAHNGHVGVNDKSDVLRERYRDDRWRDSGGQER
jgi:hypothetical protein